MNSFLEVESWEDAKTKSLGYEHPSVIRFYENLNSTVPVFDSPMVVQRVETLRKCWELLLSTKSPNVLDIGGMATLQT